MKFMGERVERDGNKPEIFIKMAKDYATEGVMLYDTFLPSHTHLKVLIHGQSLNLFASFLVCFFTFKVYRR
jgi:hypothetical protein